MKNKKKNSEKATEKPKQDEKLSDQELDKVRGGSLNAYVSKLVGEKQGAIKR